MRVNLQMDLQGFQMRNLVIRHLILLIKRGHM